MSSVSFTNLKRNQLIIDNERKAMFLKNIYQTPNIQDTYITNINDLPMFDDKKILYNSNIYFNQLNQST